MTTLFKFVGCTLDYAFFHLCCFFFWPFIAAPKCKLDFDLDYVKTFKGRSQVIQLVLQESVGKQTNFSLCLPGNFNYIKLLLKRIDL